MKMSAASHESISYIAQINLYSFGRLYARKTVLKCSLAVSLYLFVVYVNRHIKRILRDQPIEYNYYGK